MKSLGSALLLYLIMLFFLLKLFSVSTIVREKEDDRRFFWSSIDLKTKTKNNPQELCVSPKCIEKYRPIQLNYFF